MYPLKQLYSAQKIAQTSSQMTQVPIPLNVMNSCQNAMLENSNSIVMNDISLTQDEANDISQVWFFIIIIMQALDAVFHICFSFENTFDCYVM